MEDSSRLERAFLELPYIPDFLMGDVRFYFVPSRDDVEQVYHELVGKSAESWSSYYSKKGWAFIHSSTERDGPYTVVESGVSLDILDPGRFFAPKPRFRFEKDGPAYPLISLEKRRPINPWKPTYIRAINFIKRYNWQHSLPRRVQLAIWEIEECGEIPGSTSWINAKSILLQSDSPELKETLADIFYNRPEDFPLGSEVYLNVLGQLGESGFDHLVELAKHPVTRKRVIVAKTLGEMKKRRALDTLLLLLDDEDPNVRSAALRSLGKVGVPEGADPEGRVNAYLDSSEVREQVWAAEALLAHGGDEQRKFLLTLVKEDRRPLSDLGELGEIIVESELTEATPYLIQRLKDDRAEVSMDAAETLQRLTGIHIEYNPENRTEARRDAIKTYNRWWEDTKRARSAAKHKK